MNAKARKKEKRRAECNALGTTGTTGHAAQDAELWGGPYVQPLKLEQIASPTTTTSKTNRRAREERRSGLATQHGDRPVEWTGEQDCHAGWVDKGKGVAQWGKVFLDPQHPSLNRAVYAYDKAKMQLHVDKRFRNEPFVVGTEAAHTEWVNTAAKIMKSLDKRANRRANRKKKQIVTA